MDIITTIGSIIKELGFPIGVAIYLLVVLNNTVKDLGTKTADAIGKLDATLDRQNTAIDKLNETINESDEKRLERIARMDAAITQIVTLSSEMKVRLEAIEKIRQAQRTPKKQAGAS